MRKVLTAVALAGAFAARYPNSGVIGSINAGAEKKSVPEIKAAAVKGFSASSGPLKWVRATEPFFEAGECINTGDYVELRESIANWLVDRERAVFATAEEVAEAQKGN